MRWLLIGIVWLYFLVLLVGPILYMASQSFSEGLAAFWAEISRPEALHGFTLTAEISLIVLVLNHPDQGERGGTGTLPVL